MRTPLILTIITLLAICQAQQVQVEYTNQQQQFHYQGLIKFVSGATPAGSTVTFDESHKYQTIEGFGAALTDSSAYVLNNMKDDDYWTLLYKLFDPKNGLGISYIRLPISASDLSVKDYTYDDMPKGQTDPNLDHFSIDHDKEYIIPILKNIKSINSKLKIIMSPWSPPPWMKTTDDMQGQVNGQNSLLIKQFYDAYAKFFVKTIQAYASQGITIDAMTIQNEPYAATKGYPGMFMDEGTQSDFLNNHLAPAFIESGTETKVFVYDHNWDSAEYADHVLSYLNDQAKKVVGGAAFHCYGGDVSAQTTIHNKFPDYHIYMTECSGGGWKPDWTDVLIDDMTRLFIGATNNWAEASIKWALVLDQHSGPQNGDGGCKNCRGLATVNSDDGSIKYEVDYYTVGLFSRFAQQGAVRIGASSNDGNLLTAGFINTDGTRVMFVLNKDGSEHLFNLNWNNKEWLQARIPAKTVGAFKWQA